jgi:general secretion pathway protein L
MSEWLLVRLPREPSDASAWMVADAAGKLVVAPQSGALGEAAALAAGRRICALVPAMDVLLVEPELPLKSGAKLLQVVPFALEEQLADDVENLHFAVGKRADNGRTPVAVVAKALLEEWLATLQGAGLAPNAMHADAALLPRNPGQIAVVLEQDQLLASAPGRMPVALPCEEVGAALAFLLEGVDAAQDTGGLGLLLYATPADWQRRSGEVEALRERFATIKVQLLPAGPLPLFAQQIEASGAVNLLQGAYAPQTEIAVNWRAWRVAAALAAAFLGLHVGWQAWELTRLKRLERELDASIEQVFRSAMPDEQNATDARRRMERRLLEARGGGSRGDLLPAVSAVAAARGAAPDTTVRALSFTGGALELSVAAPDAASLDRINQQLRMAGWQADLTAGNVGQSGYEGRIQIRAGS